MKKDISTRHVHADLIIAWAEGAKIQFYNETEKEWENCVSPKWATTKNYRVAPIVCLCNGVVISAPEKQELPIQTKYFFPCFTRKDLVNNSVWFNNENDIAMLNAGIIHLTYEAAKAHAEAIMKLEYCYAE